MKTKILIFLIIVFAINFVKAQDNSSESVKNYSLQELKDYAVKHNFQIKNSELEIKRSKALKWETTAIGLPQVNGGVQYQNFPDIPTQLMPDFISPAIYGVNTNAFGLTPLAPYEEGKKMPVQFGSKHNADWNVSVSQIIFSGEYIIALKASKIFLELSKKAKEKTIISVKENLEKTYYLILIAQESILALDSMNSGLSKLLLENEKLLDAGFMEATDVEQVKLNKKQTENSLISLQKTKDVLYKLLKFQVGIDNKKEIKITGSIDDIIEEMERENIFLEEISYNQNIDYELVQVQESLASLSLKREKTKTLPSVVGFYSYKKQSMRDSLDFFSKEADWYPTSVWGIKLTIPIFSSGQRYAKIKQAQFELEKKTNLRLQTEQALQLEIDQTKTDFINNINTVKNTSEQRHLAKKIYNNSYKKFKIGTEQSFVLSQKQMQYYSSLTEYYRSLSNLIDKYISLKRLSNRL